MNRISLAVFGQPGRIGGLEDGFKGFIRLYAVINQYLCGYSQAANRLRISTNETERPAGPPDQKRIWVTSFRGRFVGVSYFLFMLMSSLVSEYLISFVPLLSNT